MNLFSRGKELYRKNLPFTGVYKKRSYSMKFVAGISRLFGRMFGGRKESLDQTRLVGIYMSQANARDGYTADHQANRTRRNGKFSHVRERA
jgi:hypothetical protein